MIRTYFNNYDISINIKQINKDYTNKYTYYIML